MAIGARAIAQSAVGNVIGSMAAPDHTSVVALFNSSLISTAEATMQAAGPKCLSATAAYMLIYADGVDGFGLMRIWHCQLTQATRGASYSLQSLCFDVSTPPLCKLQLQLRLALTPVSTITNRVQQAAVQPPKQQQ
jgi:hypothetical protein